ncbi:ATP synthase F0 subunit 8 (mitochondrion) [Dermatophagoides farinae]|uniref:ATP synthase F0 subunit 8 n=1 Tax=Dermatophagoides farinae TaxID=6954 RepID=UPI0001B2DB7F|nr:ATP synthase F0 subunit 8 [Dermatophagoides farinae]ACV04215.1 ATP synthase F0 subunit 8 [Dermatophagoides farinae]
MLPQMMSLPWVFVFFFLFLSVFILSLLISSSYNIFMCSRKVMKINSITIPW